jgi:hypothetical protein
LKRIEEEVRRAALQNLRVRAIARANNFNSNSFNNHSWIFNSIFPATTIAKVEIRFESLCTPRERLILIFAK